MTPGISAASNSALDTRINVAEDELSATPTLQDVALAAGVSATTASRVLNGSNRKVADPYRSRVEKAALRLGYTPNLLAQATARGSSAIIALLVADIADPYFAQIAAGVARGADEMGFVVTIAITERDVEREARLFRELRGQRPRAIILAASRSIAEASNPAFQRDLEIFAGSGGRIVMLGPGAPHARSVLIDNVRGATALGMSLGRRGYTDAIVIGATAGVVTSDDRTTGFCDGFRAAGGAILRVYRDGFTRQSGVRMMREALRDGIEPGTLVFAVSDVVAIGAMASIREAGRNVGTDIAVCGFDDIPAGVDVTPHLTTVRVPLEEFGYQALQAAVSDGWDHDGRSLPLEVVLRESTPPLRHSELKRGQA